MAIFQFDAKRANGSTSASDRNDSTSNYIGLDTFSTSWNIDTGLDKIEIKRVYWSFDTVGTNYKIAISLDKQKDESYIWSEYVQYSKQYQKDIDYDFAQMLSQKQGTSSIRISFKKYKADGKDGHLIVSNVKLNIEYEVLQRSSQFSISSGSVTTNKGDSTANQIAMTIIPGDVTYKHKVTIAYPGDSSKDVVLHWDNKTSRGTLYFTPSDGKWLPTMPNGLETTTLLTYEVRNGNDEVIDSASRNITIRCREYNEESDAIAAWIHKSADMVELPKNSGVTYFLQNWSSLIVTASGSATKSDFTIPGYCGSKIRTVEVRCGNQAKTFQFNDQYFVNINSNNIRPADIKLEVGKIAATGKTDITYVLTDSRGKKRTLQDSITVSPYSPPYISRFIVGRCGADFKPDAANKYGFAVCEPVIQKKIGNGTTENNSVTISYYDSVPDPDNLSAGLLYSRREYYDADSKRYYVDVFYTDNNYNVLKEFDATQSFTIYTFVKDAVGGYCSNKAVIQTGSVFMSWRKNVNSIGFGGIPNRSNAVYVADNMRLMWGKEYVMPANYLKVRPTSEFQISPGEHELLLQVMAQQDQNNLFTLSSRTKSGNPRTVIVCNTDCYAEFSGNVYLGRGFYTGGSGDFSILLHIADKTLGLARINPWASAMFCTFAIAPIGIALHPGDEISVSVLGSSSASGTIQLINNNMETYITIRAIDFIAAVSS